MKKELNILLPLFGLLVLLFCFWFFYLQFERERQLMKEGDGIYYGYYWENKQNQIYKD